MSFNVMNILKKLLACIKSLIVFEIFVRLALRRLIAIDWHEVCNKEKCIFIRYRSTSSLQVKFGRLDHTHTDNTHSHTLTANTQ